MTSLEQAKIAFSDAAINLELAQSQFNKAKATLISELQKPKAPDSPLETDPKL